ncbi:MAG: hypothetical protein P8020_18060 [Acidobacteriota bacterium]
MNSQHSIRGEAKRAALEAMAKLPIQTTSLINYQSKGRAVIIGDNQALEVAPRLNEHLNTLLILSEGVEEPGVALVPCYLKAINLSIWACSRNGLT